MIQYFKIDHKGAITGAEFFSSEDVIPKYFKKAWDASIILHNPIWDFKTDSWQEKVNTKEYLDSAKEKKVTELNIACQNHILNGFDLKIGNETYHFSYDREAQLNLQETFQMFQNDMIETIMWTVKLKGIHTRITLNRDVFNKVYTKSLQHKHDAIARLRDVLEPIVEQLQSVEQIDSLYWDSQVNFPPDPSVVLKENNTVDVQIGDINKTTQGLQMENEMLTMSLLEVASIVMK